MSEESDITRDDIPQIEDLKTAILAEMSSGRPRSCDAVLKDVASRLELSTRQRSYKIKGSKTTLLENRFEKARSELKAEGLVEYPARGKMKLTAAAKAQVGEPRKDGRHAAGEPPSKKAEQDLPASPGGEEKSSPSSASLPKAAPSSAEPAPADADPGVATAKRKASPAPAAAAPSSALGKYRKYAPIALVALGILLCLAQQGLVGAIFGGAGLLMGVKDSKNGNVGNPAAPKATFWAGAASILLGLALTFASCSGASPSDHPSQDAAGTPPATSQTAADDRKGVLRFMISASDWPDKTVPVQVSIEGETADGTSVSDHYEALVSTVYALEYGAGSYTIDVAPGSLVCNDVPFSTTPKSCTFDAKKNKLLTLSLKKDEAAIEAAQEAQRQKEAEAAAQEEAERQAAAEAEAERQAAEEAAAAAAAAAVAQSAASESSKAGGGEYIGNVNSHKFHLPSCGTLPKESNRTYFSSRDEAINSGYVPCKNCNP